VIVDPTIFVKWGKEVTAPILELINEMLVFCDPHTKIILQSEIFEEEDTSTS